MTSKNNMILVVGGSMSYARPFEKVANELNLELTDNEEYFLLNPHKFSLLIFTGGEDVSPSLYNRTKHRTTQNSSRRDEFELSIFNFGRKHNVPMAGICRGAQFLCVMAGGILVQDVTGHGGMHHLNIVGRDGTIKSVLVNSSHHQMQYPFLMNDDKYQVIGSMESPLSKHYALDKDTVVRKEDANVLMKMEPDIVFYPEINALAAQYHPEWLGDEHEGFKLYLGLIEEWLKPLMEARDQARENAA